MTHFSCKLENETTTFRRFFQTKGFVLRNRRLICEELTACLCNFVGSFQNSEGRKINSEGHNPKNVPQNRTNNVLFYHKRRVVSLKRGKSLQKRLKLAIFKRSENRVFPNNFF